MTIKLNVPYWRRGLALVLVVLMYSCNSNPPKTNPPPAVAKQLYRCPMHHEIVRDKPGTCPICGMDLVAFSSNEKAVTEVSLNTLLRPTNSYVLSTVPVVSIEQEEQPLQVEALGTIQYDTREVGTIAARVSGRIEKLYLRYTFQEVKKGQKIMDIYSPELLTAQQNLLFLAKNDPGNASFIQAAKEKLSLLGMSAQQLQQIIQTQKPALTVSVYSNYSGHIHDALNMTTSMATTTAEPLLTRDLMLKEGMYIQKGQTVLSVMNPQRLWAVLNIYADNQHLVKTGNPVQIVPEAMPDMNIKGKIDFIEPFYREGSKTVTARVYFENHAMNMPVGSQVKASISTGSQQGSWLPKDAVISLGMDKIVFKREDGVFKAHRVQTGVSYHDKIQIINGLAPQDEVAVNAQFLMDSESFIKVNE